MEEIGTGVRSSLGSPEVDWARDYQRGLLPPETRFPRKGDVYESLEDVELSYLTSWMAPFTGGGKATFPKGQRLVVPDAPPDPQPISVYADAVAYEAMEKLIVPLEDRTAEKYSGFYLSVSTSMLNTRFRLIDPMV